MDTRWIGVNVTDEFRKYFVYMVMCSDRKNTIYTGFTTDLDKRLKRHNEGRGAKYTRSRLPVKLIYSEVCWDAGTALGREYQIKKLTRKEKLSLANGKR
jgi:putative endonuclease